MDRCRGLGFDGASAMMGKFKGCAAKVIETYPLAKPIHCFNLRLNTVLTKSCALQILAEVHEYIYSSNT